MHLTEATFEGLANYGKFVIEPTLYLAELLCSVLRLEHAVMFECLLRCDVV
jgi:hypothetical protein